MSIIYYIINYANRIKTVDSQLIFRKSSVIYMTKDVLITVSGRQFDVGDEPVVLVTRGNYYQKNGKHYVLYEEQPDEHEGVIKNRIKFYDGNFEMVKNGAVSSALKFCIDEKSESIYRTAVGDVLMEVLTSAIDISTTEDKMCVTVKYKLHINGQFISNCEVEILIEST